MSGLAAGCFLAVTSAARSQESPEAARGPVLDAEGEGQGGGGARLGSPAGDDVGVATEPRDTIDASAPHDPNLAKLLRRAETLVAEQDWRRAQELLLAILGRAEGAAVRRTDGSLVPVTEEANRLLGRMSPEALDLYRRQYGGAAEKLLAEATEAGRPDLLEKVAVQFRHTPAGRQAIERIASIHFDRSEFGLAARAYRRLLDSGAVLEPASRLKAAWAFSRSGRSEAARELWAALPERSRPPLAAGAGLPQPPERSGNAVVEDWRLPFGDPTRSAVGVSGEPLLLQSWHRPITERPSVGERVARVTADLRDTGLSPVPAAIPLATRHGIVARTLRGVEVYSGLDGSTIWEATGRFPPERSLSGETALPEDPELRPGVRLRVQFGPDPSEIVTADQNPLTSLLFRDGVDGFLSADDERLYAVMDGATLVTVDRFEGAFPAADPAGPDPASNRLVAFDLATGRPAWPDQGGVGGPADGSRPLSGYYFFGPPTPVGDTLYVVGEKAKEIRLLALDPATGGLRYDRLLAYAQVGVDQDPVRRWWPAQVAASDGVLVCPTTVGWLIGVDRSSGSILWAYRYAPPRPAAEAAEGAFAANASGLNDRWAPSAPMIRDGKVVYTPSEEARLVCLDLYEGKLLWQQGKGTNVCAAGLIGDAAVLVGPRSVTGLDLDTGATRWTANLDPGAGGPSGRPALAADRIYLPLGGDRLRTIDAKTGAVLSDLRLPSGSGPLGNLLFHRGQLLSLSPEGITAFQEKAGLTRSIEERLAADPGDVRSLLQKASLEAAAGDLTSAAKTLDAVGAGGGTAAEVEELRQARWRVLTALVRSGGPEAEARLRQLPPLARTADERQAALRLEADFEIAAGRPAKAAEAGFRLIDAGSNDRPVPDDGGRTLVSTDTWLAGRFADLWSAADDAAQASIGPAIESRLDAATADAELGRLARIFAFHPRAVAAARELALKDLEAGRFAEAEVRLLGLARGTGPAGRQARIDLADAARRQGLNADAAAWLSDIDLPADPPQASPPAPLRPVDAWGDFRLSVVRAGSYTASEAVTGLDGAASFGPPLPFFRDRRLFLLGRQDRLAVSGPEGGLEELIPLRAGSRAGTLPVAATDGHLLFLSSPNTVQLVSPVDGRAVWSAPVGGAAGLSYRSPVAPEPMRPAAPFAKSAGLIARSRGRGAMPAANAGYVAVRGRRNLTVLDPATGATRWTRDDVPQNAAVVGTESLIYVLPPDKSETAVLRAVDGRPVDRPEGLARLPYAVAAVGDRLLTVASEPGRPLFGIFGPRTGQAVIALYDPETGKSAWSRRYPQDAIFDLDADGRLCVLNPNGTLETLDLETGEPTKLGEVPADVPARRNEAYLVGDAGSAYLIVNSGPRAYSHHTTDIPSILVNGEIFAFGRAGADLRWRKEIQNRRLLCQEFRHLPVLLFADSEMTEKAGRPYWRIDLLALDKRSGGPVLDEPFYSQTTPFFRGLAVQPDRRTIELGGYPSRLRLQAVPAADAPAPADPPAG